MDDLTTRNEIVRVPALIMAMPPFPPFFLRERAFVNCMIEGPGLLAITGGVQLLDNAFEAPGPESMIWVVPEGTPVVGALGLESVLFERCRFRDVAFVCNPAVAAMLREGAT